MFRPNENREALVPALLKNRFMGRFAHPMSCVIRVFLDSQLGGAAYDSAIARTAKPRLKALAAKSAER